jgi:hypothetical protein
MSRKPANPDLVTLENAQLIVETVLKVGPASFAANFAPMHSKASLALACRMLGALETSERRNRTEILDALRSQAEFILAPIDPGLELRVRDQKTGEVWAEAYDTRAERANAATRHNASGRTTFAPTTSNGTLSAEQERMAADLFRAMGD